VELARDAVYHVSEDAGDEVVAYGVTDQRLVIGTGSRDLGRIGTGGPYLTTNPAYAAAIAALDGGDYSVAFRIG
jgi:hypothetical protein